VVKIEVVECGDEGLLALSVSDDDTTETDPPTAMAVQSQPENVVQEPDERNAIPTNFTGVWSWGLQVPPLGLPAEACALC
jgi:hypothetical protein